MHSVHNISKPSRKREDCGHNDLGKDDMGKDKIGICKIGNDDFGNDDFGNDSNGITVCIVASHVFGGMQLQ